MHGASRGLSACISATAELLVPVVFFDFGPIWLDALVHTWTTT